MARRDILLCHCQWVLTSVPSLPSLWITPSCSCAGESDRTRDTTIQPYLRAEVSIADVRTLMYPCTLVDMYSAHMSVPIPSFHCIDSSHKSWIYIIQNPKPQFLLQWQDGTSSRMATFCESYMYVLARWGRMWDLHASAPSGVLTSVMVILYKHFRGWFLGGGALSWHLPKFAEIYYM